MGSPMVRGAGMHGPRFVGHTAAMHTHPCLHHGLEAIELRSPDGARAVITLHGGHLVSWIPAGSAGEQLYLSPSSEYAPGKAIRGGVPVIFPQFSGRGPLVRHGFARTMPWQVHGTQEGADGSAAAVLRLRDDAASRAAWPHAFELDFRVRIGGAGLTMELACRNTGDAAFSFACALHTYLRVNDVALTSLEGLADRTYWDAVDGRDKTQLEQMLQPEGEVDRVYLGVDRPLVLREDAAGSARGLLIGQQVFEDVVVWNPGAARCAALADMPPDGWRHMLCVEAVMLARPILLEAGQRWVGVQHLTVPG